MATNLSAEALSGLADMTLALANNPETRKEFAKLAKKAKLPYKFNDVEAEEAALSSVEKTVDEKLAADQRRRDAAETTLRLNTKRAKLVKNDKNPDGRFSEDDMKAKLEPFMQEHGISDYDDAATLFAAYNPPTPQTPEIATKGIWELPAGDWITNPRATARREAMKAVGDIVARRA